MTTSVLSRPRPGIGTAVLAPIGFLAAFLAVGPVSSLFADRALPLPGTPATEVAAYYAANPIAAWSTAILQVVSVVCFAFFVAGLGPALRAAGAGWLPWVGYFSTAAMVVSSAASVILAIIAATASAATVDVLRMTNFYSGGVVNVVTIGIVVVGTAFVLGRARLFGGPTRWFGFVSGGIAVLSVLSLAFYYASIALPVGRVLSMIWTIVAGVVLYHRVRKEHQ